MLNEGGGCILTIRDYKELRQDALERIFYPRRVVSTGSENIILFDLWEFEGAHYILNTYVVTDTGTDEVKVRVLRSKYYCLTIKRLQELMSAAGFRKIKVLRKAFFQPVLVGVKD